MPTKTARGLAHTCLIQSISQELSIEIEWSVGNYYLRFVWEEICAAF